MKKITLGPKTALFPVPATLVGVHVNSNPNFMVVAWCGIANSAPPMISIAMQHGRYSYEGIKQNMVFSVNVPSSNLMRETDYCGITSGSKIDKVDICGFNIFYGKLSNAPLIEECPVNLECKVVHILDLGSHTMIIGSIEETHVSEVCLSDGIPDVSKIKPFSYVGAGKQEYRILGEVIGKAHNVGRELEPQRKRENAPENH
ncbi:flavin reductase family protein [Chloroflexota bacterium]